MCTYIYVQYIYIYIYIYIYTRTYISKVDIWSGAHPIWQGKKGKAAGPTDRAQTFIISLLLIFKLNMVIHIVITKVTCIIVIIAND